MPKHSRIGASGAHRWFACPGSVRLSEKAPPQKSSIYAEEGTAAHELAEICLTKKSDPSEYLGKPMSNGVKVTEDMIEGVNTYLDGIASYMANGKYIMLVELSHNLSVLFPDLFGTADCVLISSDMKQLAVWDFKFGKTPVEVYENKQLMYYALIAINFLFEKKDDFDNPILFGWHQTLEQIDLVICQPRGGHKEGPIRLWSLMAPRLDEFAKEVTEAAEATAKPDAPLVAGDHCKFCNAMTICPAFSQQIDDVAAGSFSVIKAGGQPNLPISSELDIEQLAKILPKLGLLADWIESVEGYAYDLASAGEEIPGYKVVKRKANRKWIDADEAEVELMLYIDSDQIFTKKIISPAQAEKLLGVKRKKDIAGLYEIPDTGTTLVAESDNRKAITVGSTFEMIEEIKTKEN